MFEMKQKILAAFLDSVRMEHRIGKHSVNDLRVRKTQIPLGNITVETKAQYTTRDWDASKHKGTDFGGVTVNRRVTQGHKNDYYLTFYIIFYCFPPPFPSYLHFLILSFVRACACVCDPFRLFKRFADFYENFYQYYTKRRHPTTKFLISCIINETITDMHTCEPKRNTNNK